MWQHPVRSSRAFEWPIILVVEPKHRMQSRSQSRWNILPETGAAGAFSVEQESRPNSVLFARYWSQGRSAFSRICIHGHGHAKMRRWSWSCCWTIIVKQNELESEPPGHLTQSQSQSDSRILAQNPKPESVPSHTKFLVQWPNRTQVISVCRMELYVFDETHF